MSEKKHEPECQAISIVNRKDMALQRYDKPLLPFISRRRFIQVSAVSTAALVISPVDRALALIRPRGLWKTFLRFAGIAAGLLGFSPLVKMLTDFLSNLRQAKPEQAGAIVSEINALTSKGYMDPRNWPDTVGFNLFRNNSGSRISFPVLINDGLNGITPFFHFDISTQQALARLAGPTTIVFDPVQRALVNIGYRSAEVANMMRPTSQSRTSFGKYETTYREPDIFRSASNALIEANYNNNRRGEGEMQIGICNVDDPQTNKPAVLEVKPIAVKYTDES
jgi:hypothetical protein